ncbi:MAG: Hsp20/alpha crystallin family protein [Fimbriimonadia bacterium]
MTLSRQDPMTPFGRFDRIVRRLFDEINAPAWNEISAGVSAWAPPVDIKETESELILTAELPGVKMEDIDIEMAGEHLTIKGKREFEQTTEKDNYIRVERAYGSFSRSFMLGVPIEADKVEASYKDGVLTVTLPKSPSVRPKKVQVNVS